VFSGLAVLLAIMVIGEVIEDVQRGYQYGLKDLPESALALVLLFAPVIGLVVLSWRHLKAAERARMDTNSTAREQSGRAAQQADAADEVRDG
jgi:hypothetical protein